MPVLVSVLLLALAAPLAGCTSGVGWPAVDRAIQVQFPDVPQLPPDSLAAWLADGARTPPLLLDVRTADEYAVSRLAGAVRIDPDAGDLTVLDDVPRDTPIVAYCSVGYRSSALVQRLRDAGFERASNLQGSIFRWANQGRPVYRDGVRVREVHPYDALWGRLLADSLHAASDL